jgi:hypothetical protein
MQRDGLVLASNVSAAAPTAPLAWVGGRSALVINATTYPTACQLQMLGPSGAWINVGSNITGDGATSFDSPAGDYRLNLSGGSVAGLYASLFTIPYG